MIFRAERGAFPTSWASHLAVTDETGDRFVYAQRIEVGPQVDRSPRGVTGEPVGFDLSLSGLDPSRPATAGRPAWTMRGSLGSDVLAATLAPDEAAARRHPGWSRPGPDAAGDEATGPARHRRLDRLRGRRRFVLLLAHGDDGGRHADPGRPRPCAVEGEAWFDHQWGDFISVGGGGWDWFAVNLADGTDITLSLVRDADGSYPLVYGTLVDATGNARHLPASAFSVEVTKRWQSPATGADYPAGWTVDIPAERLVIDLRADGRGAGARHAGDHGRHLLGGLAAGRGDPWRGRCRG